MPWLSARNTGSSGGLAAARAVAGRGGRPGRGAARRSAAPGQRRRVPCGGPPAASSPGNSLAFGAVAGPLHPAAGRPFARPRGASHGAGRPRQGRFAVPRTALRPPLTRRPRRGRNLCRPWGGQMHAARPRTAGPDSAGINSASGPRSRRCSKARRPSGHWRSSAAIGWGGQAADHDRPRGVSCLGAGS